MGKLAIFLAHHLRRPRGGLVGRLLTWRMARANAALNAWSLSLLDLQPLDCVLELGCGPGHAVQGAAAGASFVAGIDVSEAVNKKFEVKWV